MLTYILFNTLIYGTLARALGARYRYAKFVNVNLWSVMIFWTYSSIQFIQGNSSRYMTILALVLLFGWFFLINTFVINSFANEEQRDLFGLIFTLWASLLLENIINVTYWPNAVSTSLGLWTHLHLLLIIVSICTITTYCFHLSYRGKVWQAIGTQTSSVRALGIRVNHLLNLLSALLFPLIVSIGILIANESAIKPSDNLFYFIKAVGIMILVGTEKKQYMFVWALLYVTLEYLCFVTLWLPISYKETLILFLILCILLIKPTWLFSFRTRTR